MLKVMAHHVVTTLAAWRSGNQPLGDGAGGEDGAVDVPVGIRGAGV